ncbi:MAG: hypothetical protein R3C18_02995 [Planctomycetaceae bacterium]
MKLLSYALVALLLFGCSPSQGDMRTFAENFVKERQVTWKDREANSSQVGIGDTEEHVLETLGRPDSESNSESTKNWLFWLDPRINNEQVCMDSFIIEIESGVVVALRRDTGLRQDIADFYRENQN